MPSSAQRAARRSRSFGPMRVSSAVRAPSRAAVAAPYTALPPSRQSASPANSSRAACPTVTRSNTLDAEEHVDDLAVLHDVVAPFGPHDPLLFRVGLRARRQEPVPFDDLRANEPALEVRMDRARRVLRPRAGRDGPRPHLVRPYREEGDEPQELIRRADEAVA